MSPEELRYLWKEANKIPTLGLPPEVIAVDRTKIKWLVEQVEEFEEFKKEAQQTTREIMYALAKLGDKLPEEEPEKGGL